MKKIILLTAVIAALSFWGCKDDETTPSPPDSTIEIAEQNIGLYSKITATWCGPCGQWGWDLNEEIIDNLEENAIATSIYGSASSKMTNATAQKLATDFGVRGWPTFSFNGSNRTEYGENGGIYTGQTKTNVIDAVTDFTNSPVEMGVGGNVSRDGNAITLNWAVKTFKDQTGTFKIGAYVLEDGVMEIQTGKTGSVSHKHVLRDKITSNIYGIDFTGNLSADSYTELGAQTYDIDPSWNMDNIEIIAIIWKNNGNGGYDFVNAARLN
jgi:hypothetical protein